MFCEPPYHISLATVLWTPDNGSHWKPLISLEYGFQGSDTRCLDFLKDDPHVCFSLMKQLQTVNCSTVDENHGNLQINCFINCFPGNLQDVLQQKSIVLRVIYSWWKSWQSFMAGRRAGIKGKHLISWTMHVGWHHYGSSSSWTAITLWWWLVISPWLKWLYPQQTRNKRSFFC